MISDSCKFIFIHIPKTGGNSLTEFLKDLSTHKIIYGDNHFGKNKSISIMDKGIDIKHFPLILYKKFYADKFQEYFKFTIVRNPYDRIMSLFFWHKRKQAPLDEVIFKEDEFKNFIINYQKFDPNFKH
jgi:hypothetical protein